MLTPSSPSDGRAAQRDKVSRAGSRHKRQRRTHCRVCVQETLVASKRGMSRAGTEAVSQTRGRRSRSARRGSGRGTHPHWAAILPLVMLRSVRTTRTSLQGSSPSALTAASSSASPPSSDSVSTSDSSSLALLASEIPRCSSNVSQGTCCTGQMERTVMGKVAPTPTN